ncbi:hypothetical protein ACLOJK_037713 [Asimina triloba]
MLLVPFNLDDKADLKGEGMIEVIYVAINLPAAKQHRRPRHVTEATPAPSIRQCHLAHRLRICSAQPLAFVAPNEQRSLILSTAGHQQTVCLARSVDSRPSADYLAASQQHQSTLVIGEHVIDCPDRPRSRHSFATCINVRLAVRSRHLPASSVHSRLHLHQPSEICIGAQIYPPNAASTVARPNRSHEQRPSAVIHLQTSVGRPDRRCTRPNPASVSHHCPPLTRNPSAPALGLTALTSETQRPPVRIHPAPLRSPSSSVRSCINVRQSRSTPAAIVISPDAGVSSSTSGDDERLEETHPDLICGISSQRATMEPVGSEEGDDDGANPAKDRQQQSTVVLRL